MPTPLERLLAKSFESDTLSWDGTPCRIWTGSQYRGYGRIGVEGKTVQAHRVSYECQVGPIPDGLDLDHLCRHTLCINPTHLEPVPHMVNVQRGDLGKARKAITHCPAGHPYSGENLYATKDGKRMCRTCMKARKIIGRQGSLGQQSALAS